VEYTVGLSDLTNAKEATFLSELPQLKPVHELTSVGINMGGASLELKLYGTIDERFEVIMEPHLELDL
jgi:hypothetical protein